MFKHLFKYWYNTTDTPAIISRINLWSFVNIRLFKFKISNIITYFILSLSNLKQKEIKILYKDLTFERLYLFLLTYLLFFCIILFFFI